VIVPLIFPPYTALEKFLTGFPFVGANPHEDIALQLAQRDASYLDAWAGADDDIIKLALRVAAVIEECMSWPNDYFVPDDPVALLIRGDFDPLDVSDTIIAVERELGLAELDEELWNRAFEGTFGELVARLVDQT
jgi:hypothetical protein